VSAGISIYPDDGSDAETLLKYADFAMYHAKTAGRNNYQFFRAEQNDVQSSIAQWTTVCAWLWSATNLCCITSRPSISQRELSPS